MGSLFRLVSLAILIGVARQPRPAVSLRSGDVVFQASKSRRGALIRRATHSAYSHVGLIEVAADGVFVIEAVEPVSRTPLAVWQARGVDGAMTVMRTTELTAEQLARVVAVAKASLGVHYDSRYQWTDERLYCSELVSKAFMRGAGLSLGHLQTLGSLALTADELRQAASLGLSAQTLLLTPESLATDAQLQRVSP